MAFFGCKPPVVVPACSMPSRRLEDRIREGVAEGVWAEVLVGKEHLRLFSEKNAQGTQASVYNVNTKSWIAPSEAVEDIEHGKDKTTECAGDTLGMSRTQSCHR